MIRPCRLLILMGSVLFAPMIALAQPGTLFVEGSNVGIGTPTPGSTLHIQKSDGTTKVLIQEIAGTTQVRELFQLVNNGGPFFVFADSSRGESYSFAMSGVGHFIISHQQTPGVQFRLTPSGDVTISGILIEGSSRDIKKNISPVDNSGILAKVRDLPISTWSYDSDPSHVRHLGPMAEDFRAAFGLGRTEKGIATLDSSGVALAAIQELASLVEQQSREIEALKTQLAKAAGRDETAPEPADAP